MADTFINPEIVGLDALRERIKRLALAPVTETLRATLVRAWEGGADAFIRAAIRRVLVDTGMSAATFLALSRSINRQRSEAIIEAHIARKQQHGALPGVPTFPSGARDKGRRQSRFEGERLGKRAFVFQVPGVGAGRPGSGRPFIFRFSFQTVAFQHAIHEEVPQLRESLEIGIDAFRQRIQLRFITQANLVVDNYLRGRTLPIQGI